MLGEKEVGGVSGEKIRAGELPREPAGVEGGEGPTDCIRMLSFTVSSSEKAGFPAETKGRPPQPADTCKAARWFENTLAEVGAYVPVHGSHLHALGVKEG